MADATYAYEITMKQPILNTIIAPTAGYVLEIKKGRQEILIQVPKGETLEFVVQILHKNLADGTIELNHTFGKTALWNITSVQNGQRHYLYGGEFQKRSGPREGDYSVHLYVIDITPTLEISTFHRYDAEMQPMP